MIIRSPSSRLVRISLQASRALPIIVPPIQCGTFSGFMNGGAQRMAEGSLVKGTQWSTLLPKKVKPNASPLRIFEELVDGLHRGVVAGAVAERTGHAAGDVDAELDVREHALGPRGAELLGAGQEHDHHGQDQGRQRLGELQRDRPDSGRVDWPPWSNGRATRPHDRLQTQASSSTRNGQQDQHGG